MGCRVYYLAVGVILTICLTPASGQVFNFPSPITFQTACGLVGNMSVDGRITLSSEDLDNDHFLPTVFIQTTSEICTIDLTSCSLEAPPTRGNICDCIKEGDTLFLLYVRKQINGSEAGKMLQASLHHHNPNNPTIVSANIGIISQDWGLSPNTGHNIITLNDGEKILCDMATDGGNWIVIQHRSSAAVDFFRNWQNYTDGFGDIHSNFWLGLNKVYQICHTTTCELRIDMKFNGRDYHATYRQFAISDQSSFFKLQTGRYEGDAGDVFTSRFNGVAFSTKDKDHDTRPGESCATIYHGGWWYDNCHISNLNGVWGSTHYGEGLNWQPLTGFFKSVSFVEMKVRPVQNGYTGQIIVGK